MLTFSCFDVMHDNVEDFINEQGYTVGKWGEMFTHSIHYVKALETFGFISNQEAQRIYNKIMITVMAYAQEIKEPTPSGKESADVYKHRPISSEEKHND